MLEIELVLRYVFVAAVIAAAVRQYRFSSALIGVVLGAGADAPMMIKRRIIHAEDLLANGDTSFR